MVALRADAVVLDSKRSHSPLGWSVVSISGTIPGLAATATAPNPKLNSIFSDYQRFQARSFHPIRLAMSLRPLFLSLPKNSGTPPYSIAVQKSRTSDPAISESLLPLSLLVSLEGHV